MPKKVIMFFHSSAELYGSDKILVCVMKNYPDYKRILVLPFSGPLEQLAMKELPDIEIKIIPFLPVLRKKSMTLTGVLAFLWSLILFRFEMKKLMRAKPNVLYLNTLAVIPVLFYCPASGVKKIVHVHEILKNDHIFNRIINKIALKRSSALVCVSGAVKKNLEKALPGTESKLWLVYNGIHFDREDDLPDYPFRANSSKLNFVLMGRIKPTHKGQNLLLEAIGKLKPEYLKKVHFYFVGSPAPGQENMLREVQSKILLLGLENYVEVIPFVKRAECVYSKVDVVIAPSVFDDPFPTTVLEGMFFCKPVIGTSVGGIPEMIEDGITGFVVGKNSSEGLRDKIIYFIEHPEKIKEMGDKGHERFSKNFTEDCFSERYRGAMEVILES